MSPPSVVSLSERVKRLLLSGLGAFALAHTLPETSRAAETSAVYFIAVDTHGDRFVFALSDAARIEEARSLLKANQPSGPWIAGGLQAGDGGYNRDPGQGRRWSWHLVPDTIRFPEITAEALQTSISGIENDLDYWLRFGACAIGARIESEGLEFTPARFVNISSRSWVGVGEDVQIAGFVVRGTARKTVLVRGAGPALSAYGIVNVLGDPVIELHDQTTATVIASNDNWSADPDTATDIETVAGRVGAAGWSRGSKDAALLLSLNPGIYTAVLRDKNNASGVALIEVFDADEPTETRLVNISARARTGGDENSQIAGFVVDGTVRKTVLIRGAGPALIPHGVSGALADPQLRLYNQKTGALMMTNDNWSEESWSRDLIESAALQVGAAPWPRGSKDAALLVTLDPGIYTAVVSSRDNTSGVSLIEVFDVR